MEFNATFFVTVISFLVFMYLMDMIFYAPISGVVNARQKMIDDLLTKTGDSKNETMKLNQERDEKILKSSEESRKIIAEKVEKANKRADLLTLNAKNASFEDLAYKKDELLKDEAKVRAKLEDVTNSLADEIVSKILG